MQVHMYITYRELGLYPLIIQRKIKILKFWCELLNTENCILKLSYMNIYDSVQKIV
jgi:hypothetical protein